MKYCTNCGAELKPGAKFCTSCGAAVEAVSEVDNSINTVNTTNSTSVESPEPTEKRSSINTDTINAGVAKTKNFAGKYWNWLKTSIKTPSDYEMDTHPYYGLTSFVLFAVLGSLQVIIPGNMIFSEMNRDNGSLSDIVKNPFTFGLFLKLAVVFLITYALYVGIGYAAERFFASDSQAKITEYTNRFAHYVNFSGILTVVALILSIIAVPTIANGSSSDTPHVPGIVLLIMIILMIAGVAFQIGFIATFLAHDVSFKIDRIYVVLIAEIAIGVITYFVVRYMVMPDIQAYIHEVISSATDNITNDLTKGLFGN